MFEQALEPWRDQHIDSDEVLSALNDLGFAYAMARRGAEAVEVLEHSARHQKPGSKMHFETLSQLDDAYWAMGRFDDARQICEQVWNECRVSVGPDHPLTLIAASKLGIALVNCGQLDLARGLLKFVVAIATELFGPDHLVGESARSTLKLVQRD